MTKKIFADEFLDDERGAQRRENAKKVREEVKEIQARTPPNSVERTMALADVIPKKREGGRTAFWTDILVEQRAVAESVGIDPFAVLLKMAAGYIEDIDPVTKQVLNYRPVDDELRYLGAKEATKYVRAPIKQVSVDPNAENDLKVQGIASFLEAVSTAMSGVSPDTMRQSGGLMINLGMDDLDFSKDLGHDAVDADHNQE